MDCTRQHFHLLYIHIIRDLFPTESFHLCTSVVILDLFFTKLSIPPRALISLLLIFLALLSSPFFSFTLDSHVAFAFHGLDRGLRHRQIAQACHYDSQDLRRQLPSRYLESEQPFLICTNCNPTGNKHIHHRQLWDVQVLQVGINRRLYSYN